MRVITQADELARCLPVHDRIVAFTGAGISYMSGLPLFSSPWRGEAFIDWLTISRWQADPSGVYALFWEQVYRWPSADPNPAHIALAKIGCPVLTQNYDGLHQKAGSKHVLELHGNPLHLRCDPCALLFPSERFVGLVMPGCPNCRQLLRPNIVLAGEPSQYWWEASAIVTRCDLLLVIGTSLDFLPASNLPQLAERAGAEVVVINRNAEHVLPRALELCSRVMFETRS